MEESRPDRVRIDLTGGTVELSKRERDILLQELSLVPGSKRLREELAAAGASRPVRLDDEQRSRLRTVLEAWDRDALLPEGITRLLTALARAGGQGTNSRSW